MSDADDLDAWMYDDTPETDPDPNRHRHIADADDVHADGKPRRRSDTSDRHTYRVLRENFRRQCAALRSPCAICRRPIDYTLSHGDQGAFELDHRLSVEDYPDLEFQPSNFEASHSVCNKRKGIADAIERGPKRKGQQTKAEIDAELARDLGQTSQVW